ncbi:MAG: hypothetical protein KKF44_08540 [Nanoarchaeota archaeon]|nr:hypothetical protein [Nanoarchaeota archaeon]
MPKTDRTIFDKEYKNIVNEGIILRTKKRTGKSSEYHLSLNPRKLCELKKMIDEGDKNE